MRSPLLSTETASFGVVSFRMYSDRQGMTSLLDGRPPGRHGSHPLQLMDRGEQARVAERGPHELRSEGKAFPSETDGEGHRGAAEEVPQAGKGGEQGADRLHLPLEEHRVFRDRRGGDG